MSPNQTSGPGPTRKQRRERARAERRAKEAEQQRSAATQRRLRLIGVVWLVLLIAASAALLGLRGGGSAGEARGQAARLRLSPLTSLGVLRSPGAAGHVGPEGVPIPNAQPVARTTTKAAGKPVDEIECSSSEQTLFHIHAHLTVFVNGLSRQVPYGIGIPAARTEQTPSGSFVGSGSCFYWLHTHAADGIIHIESPIQRVYTLGNFFDVWGQPLSPTQVGPATGAVTAIYNGQRYEGDPREIPLTAHSQIQLDVGRPLVAPDVIEFRAGL